MMDLRLAQYGMGMQEATIIGWRKQEGDAFQPGDILLEVEAAKATVEVEAQTAGVIARIVAKPDDIVEVGGLLAEIATEGADEVPARQAPAETSSKPAGERPTLTPSYAGSQVEPRARKLAKDSGIDLAIVQGSGPAGRITEEDVRAAAAGASSASSAS
jgi:pyruvate/2-oxoglutarate dehydrogenase complex dihydrolipoamide acyltransferase (E2) component